MIVKRPPRRCESRSVAGWLAGLAIAVAHAAPPAERPPALAIPYVLVVNSAHAETDFTSRELRGFRAHLESVSDLDVGFYVEHIDAIELAADARAHAAAYFAAKYRNKGVRLILTLDTESLNFVAQFYQQHAVSVPIVYCAARAPAPNLPNAATGVVAQVDPRPTLDLIEALHPAARELVVIRGETELSREVGDRLAELLTARGTKPVRYLTEPAIVRSELRDLGADSVALWLGDPQWGARTAPANAADIGAAGPPLSAAAPTYVLFDTQVGRGVIGGVVASAEHLGREAGRLAERILRGEDAAKIPPVLTAALAPMFNAPELERWNLPRAALPTGARILNDRPSFFEQYRGSLRYIAAAVVALQALLLGALWMQYRRAKAMTRALADSEDRYRRLVDHAPAAFIVHDHGQICYANAAAVRLLGAKDRSELLGKSIFQFVAPPYRAAVQSLVDAIYGNELTSSAAEREIVRLDGSTAIVETFGVRCRFEGRDCIQTMIHDVTAQRRLELQIRRDEKMRAVGIIAAGVAHDYANDLAAIRATVSRVKALARTAPHQVPDGLADIEAATDQAMRLTRELLAIGGSAGSERAEIVLDAELAKLRPTCERMLGPEVQLNLTLGAPAARIVLGALQLEQIVCNLVGNARDAMPEGGTVTLRTGVAADGAVALEVADQGGGVPEPVRPHIFDPFFTSKGGAHSGLGLSTVAGIVERAGGDIELRNEQGGAVFAVRLPQVSGEGTAAPHSANWVALIVDDVDIILQYVADTLRAEGFEAHAAADAGQAYELARQLPRLDLLITDYRMPVEDGLNLARRIRALHPDAAVLLMSVFGGAEPVLAELAKLGRAAPLRKPFEPSQLLDAVAKLRGAAVPAAN